MAIVRLVEAVMEDQKCVLPVSRMLTGEYGLTDVCLSIPSVIGMGGLEAVILPVLSDGEFNALRHSADTLRESPNRLDL